MAAEDEAETGKRIRGKRPPEGDPVIDRALALLAAFDAGRAVIATGLAGRPVPVEQSGPLRLGRTMVSQLAEPFAAARTPPR